MRCKGLVRIYCWFRVAILNGANSCPGSSFNHQKHYRNRNLKTSKALLKSQAHQGTSLFTSAATNQRGVSRGGSREAQVRIPEYQEGYREHSTAPALYTTC